MTPATYAKGGAGAHIDYTTVDSDYGRVLVAATQKGIAAVFLGDNDRTLEKDLKHDFPAADITRNDRALGPRVKNVLARLYGRKPSALDAADVPLDIVGTAFQWKVWKALTEIPAGQTRTYGEIAKRIGEPHGGPRRRPGLRHQPGGRGHPLPSRRRRERRAHRLSLGRRAQGAAAGRRTPAQQHVEGAAAAVARVRRPHAAHPARLSARFSQPRTPPGCGRPARGRPRGARPCR